MQRTDDGAVKSIVFPQHVFKVAAMWWAQYLPGVKKVELGEINKNSRLTGRLEEILGVVNDLFNAKRKPVTEEQLNAFIEILARNMAASALKPNGSRHCMGGLHCVQIGNSSDYQPPEIVCLALKEANIEIAAMGTFPCKTEMKIYNNGQIQLDKQVISTDPRSVYYDKHYNFDSAPYMIISGDKFRVLEIALNSLNGPLFKGFIDSLFEFKVENLVRSEEEEDKEITHVFARLPVGHFKGGEKQCTRLTDSELIEILQDQSKMTSCFTEDAFVSYASSMKSILRDPYYFDLGHVAVEQVAGNYYQYTTGPVKVIPAPGEGSVDGYDLRLVRPNDFLIFREKNESVCVFHAKERYFSAQFCDKNGKVLSPRIFRPGDVLSLTANHADRLGLFSGAKGEVEATAVAVSSQTLNSRN